MDDDKPKKAAGRNLRHVGGFAVAGVAGFVVDSALLTAGVALGFPAALARAPSFLAAVVTTWLINRSLTFRTTAAPSLGEFLRYLGAMSLGLAINYGVFLLVLSLSALARGIPVLALVPATAAGMAANFLTSRRLLDR